MSAVLADLDADTPAISTAPKSRESRGRTFPVGARFPRRTLAQELTYLEGDRPASPAKAPIFPVGARFPRRTEMDAMVYVTELAASDGGVAPTRLIYPVGARFPRR